MSKIKSIYACTRCGAQYPKWVGQCMECGAWNSLVEESMQASSAPKNKRISIGGDSSVVMGLADIPMVQEARFLTGFTELDRVLGGGLVNGSVILIGGDPGIGKSTLLLQALCHLSQHTKTLYVTGEESLQQVALRAQRLQLNTEQLRLVTETNIENIMSIAKREKPNIIVIDSIQTMFTDNLQSAPGAVGQVRESAAQLVNFAKSHHVALFLVGHVTKEGAIAGPRVLEHMVDCVLYFEGERDQRWRMIRAVKNRFGAVNELGVFAMTERGLREVNNPSAIFLVRANEPTAGSIVTATWEGTRPLLVEVQALVDQSHLGNPRRVAVGLEQNRLAMLLAVLHRHTGIVTHDQDVFVNVVGGIRVTETAVDLALLLAVVSSLRNRILPIDLIAFGEVGLAGEIRPVQGGQERLQEAFKHGFKHAIVPYANAPKKTLSEIKVYPVKRLDDAIACLAEM